MISRRHTISELGKPQSILFHGGKVSFPIKKIIRINLSNISEYTSRKPCSKPKNIKSCHFLLFPLPRMECLLELGDEWEQSNTLLMLLLRLTGIGIFDDFEIMALRRETNMNHKIINKSTTIHQQGKGNTFGYLLMKNGKIG